jgi:SPP1 gp7 family putative phage head morphogenesis protein
MPEFLFAPSPHNEAIDFIKSKPVVSQQVFNELLPELRARAFTIAGIEDANVLQSVRDTIATLPAGQSWDVVKKSIISQISPYIVDPNATEEERAAQEAAAEAKAELLLRVHGNQAYEAASYRVMDAQRAIFKYWQYRTIGDSHVRPTHAALDGLILPHDSSFWDTHFPPWAWGCRCTVIPMSDASVAAERERDAARAPDERMVLDGPLLRELELNNRLVRGPNNIINVQSPFEAGEPGAFHWHPGELSIPLDELKARYDPQVWRMFQNWAEHTRIADDAPTVWEWLNGADASLPAPEIASTTEVAKITETLLPNHLVEYLRQQPESGMGYQIVDITLKNGNLIRRVRIENSGVIKDERAANFDSADIATIRMSDAERN